MNVTSAGLECGTCRQRRPAVAAMLQHALAMLHSLTLTTLPWTLRLPGPATIAGAALQVCSAALGGGRLR